MSSPFGDSTPIDFQEDIHDAITGTIITATVEFRGTVFTSNAASDIVFKTSGGTQFIVSHATSAVNYLLARGSAGTDNVLFAAEGNATNLGLSYFTKGTGQHVFKNTTGTHFKVRADISSAVNYPEVFGMGTGVAPEIRVSGTDTNVTMRLGVRGAGNFRFSSDVESTGVDQFRITHTANAVNYGTTTGAPTGNSIWFSAEGNDTNVQAGFASQGNSPILFRTNSKNGSTQFAVSHEASAVNYMSLYGAISANNPHFNATGSDTNIGISFFGKGAGYLLFDPGGGQGFRVNNVVSAVNSIAVLGAVTGFGPTLQFTGSDTDVPSWIVTKGTGRLAFAPGGTYEQFRIGVTANAVNHPRVTGGVTGSPAIYGVSGTDTDVDVSIVPQGAGVVRFGTHTALGAEVLSGYITIKDSGGTTRKLAVIS